ncbi:MAG: hypothetical protein JWO38_8060 [Gemmataceae bacterium]|nr:hypothetical protein [Gemmataceae bacterium]
MTAPRRSLLLLLAGLAVGPIPACLHTAGTTPPADPGTISSTGSHDFATLPSRPGEVIPTNPAAKAAATGAKPAAPATSPDAGPRPAAAIQTTSRSPTPEPEAPLPPGSVAVVKPEPGPLPLIPPPPAPEPPLLAAMRAYVENRPADAIRYLQALDRGNQDFALAVMPLLVRGAQINLAAANPEDVAVLVDQCYSVAGRLEGKAALRVEKVAFCRRVSGFGRYEPWPEALPYRPNDLAVLYVEVRNVGSEPAAGPNGEGYVSRAAVSLEVRDATGKLVEQTDPADWRRRVPVARFDHADYTRSPLRDYSRTYRISVPAQPGVYTVTVEVKDPSGGRAARSQPAEFRVGAP